MTDLLITLELSRETFKLCSCDIIIDIGLEYLNIEFSCPELTVKPL